MKFDLTEMQEAQRETGSARSISRRVPIDAATVMSPTGY
jgi:hypothetical protein